MDSYKLNYDQTFEEIYQRNFNLVYEICYMYLKNSKDAEDVVQNIFTKLYTKKIIFNDLNHEKAWFIVASKNASINNIKHFWNKVVRSDDIEVICEDKIDNTLKEILKLEEKYLMPIYLFYYMGYTSKEISDILNKNESTIRSLLLRGKKILKDVIKG